MRKENLKNSIQYKKLKATIEEAISQTNSFRNNRDLSMEQIICLAIWSGKIMVEMRNTGIYVRNDYINEFSDNEEKKATINPLDERVKMELLGNETVGKEDNEYTKIHANSFGPFNPLQYFKFAKRIVVVDWEPYVLDGDLEKLRKGEISYLGGRKQEEDFPTYKRLEAPTHTIAVDFCQKLLSKFSTELPNDEVMGLSMCILEHNFFPALAFSQNISSDKDIVQKIWTPWTKEILSLLLQFYNGRINIGSRNNLNYLCSGHDALFNVARDDYNTAAFEGESTESLSSKCPDAAIIGRKIKRSWFNHKLGGKGASALLDDNGCLWIGYVHFASRRGDQWSPTDQKELAAWIKRIMPDLFID